MSGRLYVRHEIEFFMWLDIHKRNTFSQTSPKLCQIVSQLDIKNELSHKVVYCSTFG